MRYSTKRHGRFNIPGLFRPILGNLTTGYVTFLAASMMIWDICGGPGTVLHVTISLWSWCFISVAAIFDIKYYVHLIVSNTLHFQNPINQYTIPLTPARWLWALFRNTFSANMIGGDVWRGNSCPYDKIIYSHRPYPLSEPIAWLGTVLKTTKCD